MAHAFRTATSSASVNSRKSRTARSLPSGIGEEATLKRFYRQGDTVMLQAENPAFSPLVYTRDQLNEITIEGRVVGICRGI